jgi:hypothetical protein
MSIQVAHESAETSDAIPDIVISLAQNKAKYEHRNAQIYRTRHGHLVTTGKLIPEQYTQDTQIALVLLAEYDMNGNKVENTNTN